MHELALTRNIVALVAEHAGGRRVRRVRLRIGRLAGVMVEAVRFCFPLVAEGTVVEGAELVIEQPEGRAQCLDCGREFVQDAPTTPCPCGSRRFRRVAGEELVVAGFELLVEEAGPTQAEEGG